MGFFLSKIHIYIVTNQSSLLNTHPASKMSQSDPPTMGFFLNDAEFAEFSEFNEFRESTEA